MCEQFSRAEVWGAQQGRRCYENERSVLAQGTYQGRELNHVCATNPQPEKLNKQLVSHLARRAVRAASLNRRVLGAIG